MRLCVITHTFPPSTHANAKRPHYLVKGFLDSGWQVDVYTHWTSVPVGANESLSHPALRIFRVNDPIEKVLRYTRPRPWLYRVVGLSLAGIMWPDVYAHWVRTVIGQLRSGAPYDRTLAFVIPAAVLLAGGYPALVDRNWIFDYQESVTPHYRRSRRRSPLQKWLQPRLEALERRTLHRAGQVVFTADTNRRAYIEAGLVPAAVAAHVPYFFDAAVFAKPSPPPAPDFEVVYFGTFDWHGARSPETFLRALAAFLSRTPEARSRTRFTFHGHWMREHDCFIDEFGLHDVVRIQAPLGYAEYLERLRRCPVLLLVVAPEHDLFMPSKIVDYFGARRPILAFVPRSSEMYQVLHLAGMLEFVSEDRDVDGGVRALANLWSRFRDGALNVSSEKVAEWSSENQIPRYLELVTRCGMAR